LPDGDAIGVIYTKLNGDVISDGFLSVEQQSVDLTIENAAGIYTVQETFDLDDGSIVEQNEVIRLYPNGTGAVGKNHYRPGVRGAVILFIRLLVYVGRRQATS
jgi:hypothetical protein